MFRLTLAEREETERRTNVAMQLRDLDRFFVTADPHLGHERVRVIRGFDSQLAHDNFLVRRMQSVLNEKSTLIIVGDVSMNAKHLSPLSDVPGKKILISGNHDELWHRRSKSRSVRKALGSIGNYTPYFNEVVTSGVWFLDIQDLKTGDPGVVISHLPVVGDHQDTDRYQEVRPRKGTLPVLCGHVHAAWRTNNRQLNVGVDVNDFKPLPMRDVIQEVLALPGFGANQDISASGPWSRFGLA